MNENVRDNDSLSGLGRRSGSVSNQRINSLVSSWDSDHLKSLSEVSSSNGDLDFSAGGGKIIEDIGGSDDCCRTVDDTGGLLSGGTIGGGIIIADQGNVGELSSLSDEGRCNTSVETSVRKCYLQAKDCQQTDYQCL